MTDSIKHFFIIAFIFINVLVIIAAGFMIPLWSDFVTHIGGDVRTAGKAILLFSMVIGLVTCLAGVIESKFKHDRFYMIAAQAVMCLGYAGYFFVHNPQQLYMVQIILGVGGAFQSPVLCALYQQVIPKEKSSQYWGVWNGFYQIAMGIGALSSAYIVHHYSYTPMFSAMLAIGVFCLVLVIWVMQRNDYNL